MKRIAAPCLMLLLLVVNCSVLAQQPDPKDDPIGRSLHPPEMVMKHQMQIGLAEAQRTAIRNELQKAQSKFIDLQFQIQAESEKLGLLLQSRPVDEARVLAQADTVMNLEREIKKTHLSLLVRIHNVLSEEQQAKLWEIRKSQER